VGRIKDKRITEDKKLNANDVVKNQNGIVDTGSLDPRWQDWRAVQAACTHYAILIFDHIVGV
jgi:hypothetical protein